MFPLNGYLNVHPNPPKDTKDLILCDLFDLNKIADNNECDEIRAEHILEYVPKPKIGTILRHWLSKIAKNGYLTIICTDIHIVAKQLLMRTINIGETQAILYGQGELSKCTAIDTNSILEFFIAHGIKPIEKNIDGFNFMIKGQRV
jgi:hypothetical protein